MNSPNKQNFIHFTIWALDWAECGGLWRAWGFVEAYTVWLQLSLCTIGHFDIMCSHLLHACVPKSFYRSIQHHIKSVFNNEEVRNSFHRALFNYSPSFKNTKRCLCPAFSASIHWYSFSIVTRKSHSLEVLISVSRSMTQLSYIWWHGRSYRHVYVCMAIKMFYT